MIYIDSNYYCNKGIHIVVKDIRHNNYLSILNRFLKNHSHADPGSLVIPGPPVLPQATPTLAGPGKLTLVILIISTISLCMLSS